MAKEETSMKTEITAMEVLVEVMKPIVDITEVIGGEKRVTVSAVYIQYVYMYIYIYYILYMYMLHHPTRCISHLYSPHPRASPSGSVSINVIYTERGWCNKFIA